MAPKAVRRACRPLATVSAAVQPSNGYAAITICSCAAAPAHAGLADLGWSSGAGRLDFFPYRRVAAISPCVSVTDTPACMTVVESTGLPKMLLMSKNSLEHGKSRS